MDLSNNQKTIPKLITTDSYFNVFPLLVKELEAKTKNINRHNIVFCEEKFTLMAERFIVGEYGGTFNTDVYSFGKYLRGRDDLNKKILSKEGSCMVVRKVLSENELSYLPAKKVNLSTTLYELIAQIKSAGVTVNDIKGASERAEGILKRKLYDIFIVYQAYEKFLVENSFYDQNSLQNLVFEAIKSDESLKDSDIYIVGYSSWTAQTREIIKELLLKANSVTAILTKGDNHQVFVNQTYSFFHDICSYLKVRVNSSEVKSEYSEEGYRVIKGLYNPKECTEKKDTDNVYFNCYATQKEEVSTVAEVIKAGVMKKGLRYKDFTIAVSDKAYYRDIEKQFRLLGIPYFLDNGKNAVSSPLVTLICAYADAFIKNRERSTLIAFAKNPLVIRDADLADEFENYILKYNITYNAINNPFTAGSQDEYEKLEEVRKRIVSLLSGKFDVVKLLKNVSAEEELNKLGDELIALGENELGDVTKRIYAKVCDILNEMELILECKYTYADFKKVFISGINALEMYAIPQYNDAVFIGGYKECALAKANYLFAVGLTTAVPIYKDDVALLTDGDIDKLKEIQVIVEPKIKVVNNRAKEELVMALGAFKEKLYLSYPKTDITGNGNDKSEIFLYIDSLFNCKSFTFTDKYLTEKQGALSFALSCGSYAEGKDVDFDKASAYYKVRGEIAKPIVDFANLGIAERIDCSAIIENKTSPTHIEEYYNCPYKAFAERGLKLTEREDGSHKPNTVGTFIHDVLGYYVKDVNSVADKASSDKLFDSIIEKIKKKYYTFFSSEKPDFISQRIIDETKEYCFKVFEFLSNSDFKPIIDADGTEVIFDDDDKNKKYPSISLLGGQLKLKGRIDRVDVYGGYCRIIDYKTGSTKDSEKEKSLFDGTKLQLYLYAVAVNDKETAGVYYIPIEDGYSRDGIPMYSYGKGRTVNSDDLIKNQDRSYNEGTSKMLGIAPRTQNKLTDEQMKGYKDYALRIAEKGAEQMKGGIIVPSPIKNACDYCPFGAMCGDDKTEREIGKVTKDTITGA